MKRALGQDGTKVFDEHAFGEKDIIPDGQRNEFEITNKGKKIYQIMESVHLRIWKCRFLIFTNFFFYLTCFNVII